MKGSAAAVAAAAARWTRSSSRFHGGGAGGCGGRLVGGVAIVGTNNTGGACVSRTTCARMSSSRSLAFTHKSATAAASANSRSSLAIDFQQHHRPQQQQWRHLVMITKTKAGDNTNQADDAAAANVVDTLPRFPQDNHNNKEEGAEVATLPHSKTKQQLLHITDACWNKIEQLAAAKQQTDLYLRLVIDAGGCSGFSYKFEFDTDQNLASPEEDIVFTRSTSTDDDENNNNSGDGGNSSDPNNSFSPPRVVVDAGSLEFIQGSTIDYEQEMIKSSFQVRDNPQSESACGCGSSFAVKNFTANPALD